MFTSRQFDAATNRRTRLDFSETVTVLVGKGEKAYTLHTCYARKSSEFLSTALNGSWKEAKDGKIRLPDANPCLFEHYSQWLYTGELDINLDKEDATKEEIAAYNYEVLMRLYVMAHFLLDTAFRNVVVDSTIKTLDNTKFRPGVPSIRYIWDKTPEKCAMKRLITRLWTLDVPASHFRDTEGYPGFQASLLEDFCRLRDSSMQLEGVNFKTRCSYHEHDEQQPRCT